MFSFIIVLYYVVFPWLLWCIGLDWGRFIFFNVDFLPFLFGMFCGVFLFILFNFVLYFCYLLRYHFEDKVFYNFYVQLLYTLLRVLVLRFYCGPIPHLIVCFLLFVLVCHSFENKVFAVMQITFFYLFFLVKKHTWKTWKGQIKHLTNITSFCRY